MIFKAQRLLAGLFITLFLFGCSGNAPLPSSDTGPERAQAAEVDVRTLLESAQNSTSPLKEHYYLLAAKQLHETDRSDWAYNLLQAIDSDFFESDDLALFADLFSDIAMQQQAWFLAERILTNPALEQVWSELPTPTQIRLGQRRAELFALLGEPTNSIRERIRLANTQVLSTNDTEPSVDTPLLNADQNQDAIWQTLMSLPQSQLQTLSQSETDPLLKGWFELATLSKNNQSDLSRQLAQVDNWIARWAEHPASLRLPSDLQVLRQLIREQAQHVALLLPMNGKLAKSAQAVRDGFMAAYYRSLEQGSFAPKIRTYDTSTGENINEIYNRAIREGAELVIGPLDKQQVAELNLNLELPVPTLALNYNDTPGQSAADLFQLGLAIEDEAKQAAQRAYLEGHRLAMSLTPNTKRGRRAAAAFSEEWESLGGEVVQNSFYRGAGDFSDVILKSLKVGESHRRAKEVRALFGRLEFEPRRRQDIDMIFLDANPSDARQIKPTLAFHYASKLPVYATRNIYSGRADRKADRDLNGVKFSTLPWTFDTQSIVKANVLSHAKPSPAYYSLYALGVDAYRLYPRLRQLAEVPQARLYGSTGVLSLNDNRQILREQTWAHIQSGRAKQLTTLAEHQTLR
jgi:outer membrane PBP1 activator LpoA protein